MVEADTLAIAFSPDSKIKVTDLGCRTGTIPQVIQQKFPKAEFTCVNISENMLQITQSKVGSGYRYLNFNHFEFPEKYDVIVSSLALHHLETDENKQSFYSLIYNALTPEGIFINGDVVTASTTFSQNIFIQKWIEYMNRKVSLQEIENKWLPNYYAEDRPISLTQHLNMLHISGFNTTDVIWKYYEFAVYSGQKA